MNRSVLNDERAVTEVLGHVLIFAVIVLLSISVFTFGIGDIEDQQRTAKIAATTSELTAFANNIEHAHRGGRPSTGANLTLGNGQLAPNGTVTITVTVESDSTSKSMTFTPTIVTYNNRDRSVTYAAGAVYLTRPNNNPVIKRDAPLRVTENNTIIEIVNINMPASQTATGEATITGTHTGSQTKLTVEEPVTVNVTVDGPGANAWSDMLRENGFEQAPGAVQNETHVKLQSVTDAAFIRESNVTVTTES